MKLSALTAAYATGPFLKARLRKGMRLNDGTVFRKGTMSDILIDKGDGTYHFEAKNLATTVSFDEIEIIG